MALEERRSCQIAALGRIEGVGQLAKAEEQLAPALENAAGAGEVNLRGRGCGSSPPAGLVKGRMT